MPSSAAFANLLRCARRRLQRVEVQLRQHGDERPPRRGAVGRIREAAPRKCRGLIRQHAVEHRRASAEQTGHLAESDLSERERQIERGVERLREAGERRVVRERIDERARLRELLRDLFDLVRRQIEQAVVLEERAALGLRHRLEALRLLRERGGEFVRGGIGEFLGGRLNDDQQCRAALRKRLVDGLAARSPLGLRLDQLADVGADSEVMDDINRGEHAEQERNGDNPRRPADGEGDEASNVGRQHEDATWCLLSFVRANARIA
jgi:hypothetical protein